MAGRHSPESRYRAYPPGSGNGFTAAMTRHPAPAYYVLTFAISWGGIAAIQVLGRSRCGLR